MRTHTLRAGVLTLAALVALVVASPADAATDLPAPTGTAPVTGTGTADPWSPDPPTLVGVRVGRHDRYDRTVFDFTGGTPSYRVEYGPLIEQGRGNVVPLRGAATLRVIFTGAFAYDIDTGRSTIDLGTVLNPEFDTLRQVKFGGAFEGVIGAGLGVRDRVGFRVLQLQNPPRVAVDVAHQPTQPFGTEVVWAGHTGEELVLDGIRSGAHPGYDRLVLDLGTPAVPLTFVAYRQGTSTVVIGLTPISLHATVNVPHRVPIGLTELRGATVEVHENGTVSIFVDTARRHGFRVMELNQPTRLVVDFAA